jgi:hypothetical protein
MSEPRNIAAAWHFVWYQQELPGRGLEEKNGVDTAEFSSLQAGIMRVRQQRGDIPGRTSPTTRRWHTTLGEFCPISDEPPNVANWPQCIGQTEET